MATSWVKRGPGRFEIRVHIPDSNGPGTRSTYSRTAKLELGLLALSKIAEQWAHAMGAVKVGTTVDLIDTSDGGAVAQLKFLGFEAGTIDAALNVLRTNGFPHIQEVSSGKQQGA